MAVYEVFTTLGTTKYFRP